MLCPWDLQTKMAKPLGTVFRLPYLTPYSRYTS
nr:MAG TPA: hypothetical protein [Caudoviricetes sp.]DAM68651.1 MAG TPA: hypothetical protein [Caudoviricetes sp.]